MNSKPFFTIGIPVYNSESWLGECIESILSQSFADFEIICVNDGSTDTSPEILNRYAAKDSRIRLFSRQNNGLPAARNTALAYAQGRYIFFIDSDDTMCENFLQQAFNAITQADYPDILQTGFLISSNGNITERRFPYPGDSYFDPRLTKQERFLGLWLDKTFVPQAASRVTSVDFLRTNGLYYSVHYKAAEDRDFAMSLMQRFDTIAYGDFNSFIYYHPREGSMTTLLSRNYLHSILTQLTCFYNEVEGWTIPDSYREKIALNRAEFAVFYRDFILKVFKKQYSEEEIFSCIALIDTYLGKEIKKLPLLSGRNGIITLCFRIFGIVPTCTMLYSYFKLKGNVN